MQTALSISQINTSRYVADMQRALNDLPNNAIERVDVPRTVEILGTGAALPPVLGDQTPGRNRGGGDVEPAPGARGCDLDRIFTVGSLDDGVHPNIGEPPSDQADGRADHE